MGRGWCVVVEECEDSLVGCTIGKAHNEIWLRLWASQSSRACGMRKRRIPMHALLLLLLASLTPASGVFSLPAPLHTDHPIVLRNGKSNNLESPPPKESIT